MTGAGTAEQLQVRKLDDNYFENWPSGTELGREGFKHLMRIELRRYEQTQERNFTILHTLNCMYGAELQASLSMNLTVTPIFFNLFRQIRPENY
jgi:hypothetical protein